MATLVAPLPVPSCISDHMTDAQQQSVPADLPKLQPNASPARKPKLSLQTTSLTGAYGSLSRSIAPNTAQATYTPTTSNTLTNQWDLSIRPSPISRTESPRPIPTKQQLPYTLTLPFGIRSILKNSPLPRQASVSASPRDSRRKVFFPQPKKVTFRSNLEDDIETKVYVAKHADLSSSEDESSSENTSTSSQNTSDDDVAEYPSPQPSRKRKIRRETLTPIETPAQDQDTQSEMSKDDTSLKSSHSCKRRKWQWTLPTSILLSSSSENADSSPPKTESSATADNTGAGTSYHQSPQTTNGEERDQDQERASHLDPCEACSHLDTDPDSDQNLIPKTDLGSSPDVSKPELRAWVCK